MLKFFVTYFRSFKDNIYYFDLIFSIVAVVIGFLCFAKSHGFLKKGKFNKTPKIYLKI